jgi:hypothetical protein
MGVERLVVHIGDPKTGSTSIQRCLFDRRWTCPTVTLDYPPAITALPLVALIRNQPNKRREAKGWKPTTDWAAHSTAQIGVLSAEQFSGVPPADLHRALKSHLPQLAARARIVAYIRPHHSRFLSSYAQRIKAGHMRKSLYAFGADPGELLILQMHQRFVAWRDEFGRRLVVRPMVRRELQDGDVVSDFLGIALNGAPFTLTAPTDANVSLSAEALSGLRWFHAALKTHEVSSAERHSIGSRVSSLVSVANPRGGTRLKLHKALYQRLVDSCLEDARALDRDFFGRPVMADALLEGEADTVDQEIKMDASVYYAPTVLSGLDKTALAVASLIKRHPEVWHKAYKRDLGRLTPGGADEGMSADALQAISRTDALLGQAATLLAI